ncbi:LacI family DNA-binding transcriptional regulator [Kineosporia rhizophila]|uniref:LacI family DNA-binding transcriptional regulator n=1 Tax=Kineosporia TaxID=49184 RepID=UPI001E63FA9D|nr:MULTISPECIES: LacI family DNA-binding transcriptional regulator [Kineosporia]MCE0538823.1 LacI family DNA-binding transcriptional regulator [Kineosporia rhizophila]GLY18741.1 transcriptional regulator [Kineosporia sp. NBRC 101677]
MSSRPGRATLATIAEAAGVSIATVSKVVNGRDDVSPGTRAMVEELLRAHYYTGRGGSRQTTIEVVFAGPLAAYSNEVMEGVLSAAGEPGVAVMLSKGRGLSTATAWALAVAKAGRSAVISVSNEMTVEDATALARAKVPLVVVDPLTPAGNEVTSVGSTNYAGGVSAAEHLLSLGHTRMAYLGGEAEAGCNQARWQGFRSTLEAAGHPVPHEHALHKTFRYAAGVAGGDFLLDSPTPPTAVFAGSDEIAVGLIEACRRRGLRVPEDLSVIGFDDTQLAEFCSPPLTVVRQPLREMGRVAVRTALQLAAGATVDSHHVELATSLVVRASTAPPRR